MDARLHLVLDCLDPFHEVVLFTRLQTFDVDIDLVLHLLIAQNKRLVTFISVVCLVVGK